MDADFQYLAVLEHFYPEDTPLRQCLLKHSRQVQAKALAIVAALPASVGIDKEVVSAGAMLHDIGIGRCHAPGIFCTGEEHYLRHGILGAAMLREYGQKNGMDLEPLARICERHTGSGITAQEIRQQGLPLPERDFLPETLEEMAVCLGDKFFSKSGDMGEKTPEQVVRGAAKFGQESLQRLLLMAERLGVQLPSVN